MEGQRAQRPAEARPHVDWQARSLGDIKWTLDLESEELVFIPMVPLALSVFLTHKLMVLDYLMHSHHTQGGGNWFLGRQTNLRYYNGLWPSKAQPNQAKSHSLLFISLIRFPLVSNEQH